MYKLFFIAKNNMKKQKGDMITFFILTFIAALLIFDCASAMGGMGHVLEDRFKAVNGPEVVLVMADKELLVEAAEEAFKENPHLEEYEAALILNSTTEYRNKKDDTYEEYQFFAEAFEDQRKILNITFEDENGNEIKADTLGENDVIMPYYTKNRFSVGDTFELKCEDDIFEFRVAGYNEDPYMCSALNISIFHIFIARSRLEEINSANHDSTGKFWMYKGKVKDGVLSADFDTEELEKEIGESYKAKTNAYGKEHPELNVTNYMLLNWDTMKSGGQILPMLVMAIFMVFALLLLIIAILIISFSVKNFIQRNMKNTGILEASGYTVKELRRALSVQLLLVSGLGSIVGVLVGTLTFGGFGNVVGGILGLTWNQPANLLVAGCTVLGLLLLVWLVSVRISRTYKKITVLTALRGGLGTHNFKKNHFPLEKTGVPMPLVLSLKETFGNPGRNIAMVLIAGILTIAMLCGFGMLENFGTDPEKMIELTGTTHCKLELYASEGLTETIEQVEGVTKVMSCFQLEPNVSFGSKEKTVYVQAIKNPEETFDAIILEGRLPRQANEVMLTAILADDLGAKVGDVVKITFADVTEEYLVTGLNQRMERMGRSMILTEEGGRKLLPATPKYHYNVYANEDVSYDTLKDRVEQAVKGMTEHMTFSNMEKWVNESMGGIMDAMEAICLVFSVVTLLVVIFVESLVIRAKMVREWRGMGISKAMGMTSGGLISQIMLSNIPAILGGVLLGTLLAQWVGIWSCKALLAMFGIRKVSFEISPLAMLITAAAIILVALITSGLQGLKVRKLQPVDMITEE